MKVWVPIDLPEGARVRDIIVEFGPGGPAHTRILEPLGPVWRGDNLPEPVDILGHGAGRLMVGSPPEPQRERWEYRSWSGPSKLLAELGAEGWEAYAVSVVHGVEAVWFKRRLP